MTIEIALQHFEKKMTERRFRWILNFLLMLVIFANAKVGSLIGIKTLALPISVVWPATGVSLAALLLFGYKSWPGIFLGNLIYNLTNLCFDNPGVIGPVLVSISFSLGSLAQSLVSGYIMKKYTSVGYLNTVKDVFIFLIPASVLTNVIASSVGIATLYIYGNLSADNVLYTWLTFLIGDTMGVYIITPAILVWSILKEPITFKQYMGEALLMVASFILISYFSFCLNLPVSKFFIPLAVWTSYRYRKHGATIAIFAISLVSIIATTYGYGIFLADLSAHSLIYPLSLANLIVFIEIIVGISLVVANMTNERDLAISSMQSNAEDLKQSVKVGLKELQEMSSEVLAKEKLESLGLITNNMAKEVQTTLKIIKNYTHASLDCVNRINETLNPVIPNLNTETTTNIQNGFEILKKYLDNIVKFETHTRVIAQIVQEEAALIASKMVKLTTTDLNSLVNLCIIHATTDEARLNPEFVFAISKDFGKDIKMIFPFPDDLAQALKHIFKFAIHSMKEKKDQFGERYQPQLTVQTLERDDDIVVTIRDNGIGVSEKTLKVLFKSLMKFEETKSIGMSLAHDIIVLVYHGVVSAESKEGEYLQIQITLPKSTN